VFHPGQLLSLKHKRSGIVFLIYAVTPDRVVYLVLAGSIPPSRYPSLVRSYLLQSFPLSHPQFDFRLPKFPN